MSNKIRIVGRFMSDLMSDKCEHGYKLVHKRNCRDCEVDSLNKELESLEAENLKLTDDILIKEFLITRDSELYENSLKIRLDQLNESTKLNIVLKTDNAKMRSALEDIKLCYAHANSCRHRLNEICSCMDLNYFNADKIVTKTLAELKGEEG